MCGIQPCFSNPSNFHRVEKRRKRAGRRRSPNKTYSDTLPIDHIICTYILYILVTLNSVFRPGRFTIYIFVSIQLGFVLFACTFVRTCMYNIILSSRRAFKKQLLYRFSGFQTSTAYGVCPPLSNGRSHSNKTFPLSCSLSAHINHRPVFRLTLYISLFQ